MPTERTSPPTRARSRSAGGWIGGARRMHARQMGRMRGDALQLTGGDTSFGDAPEGTEGEYPRREPFLGEDAMRPKPGVAMKQRKSLLRVTPFERGARGPDQRDLV